MKISAVIVETLQHQHVGERELKLLLKQQRWSLGALPSGVHIPYALLIRRKQNLPGVRVERAHIRTY